MIDGGLGNNSISGGNDNDTIIGGAGDDTIDVGGGFNTVVYNAVNFGADVINSFDLDAEWSAKSGQASTSAGSALRQATSPAG